MKRREERKRARNALIEETTRLEAASGLVDTVPVSIAEVLTSLIQLLSAVNICPS